MTKKTIAILFGIIQSLVLSGQQRQQIDSLNLVLRNTTSDTVKCTTLLSLGEIYSFFNPDSSILFLSQAEKLALSNTTNSISSKLKRRYIYFNAYALYCIGIAEMNKNDLSKAQKYTELSQKKYELINDKEGIANCLNNIGYICFTKGDITNTLNYYNRALKLYKEIDFKEGLAASYVNTAAIYIEQGDTKNALKYNIEGLALYRIINNDVGTASSLQNIGSFYLNGDPLCGFSKIECDQISQDKALNCFFESLKIWKKINDKKNAAAAYNLIGLVYNKKKDTNKAESYFNLSFKLASEANSKRMMANASENLSDIYSRKNQLHEATNYANNSLKWAKEIGYIELIKSSSFKLKELYRKQNKFKEALEMNDLWLLMRDSIANDANKKENLKKNMQLAFDNKLFADSLKVVKDKEVINVQLESQKNQKRYLYFIIVLSLLFGLFVFYRLRLSNRQKSVIEEKNTTIQKSLQEKEVLLKEIHHRVKNNLQVISSLLGLQSANIIDEQVKKIFAENKNKIQAIGLIHQTLYQSDNLAEIEMNDYFTNLFSSISSIFSDSNKSVIFNIKTNDIKFDIDTSVPLGLIFNELVTNSLKYAFNTTLNGTINCELKLLHQGVYSLIIADTGVGFDGDNTRTNSLGLKLVKMLASQLNGNVEIDTEQGTKITVIFEDTNQRKLSE